MATAQNYYPHIKSLQSDRLSLFDLFHFSVSHCLWEITKEKKIQQQYIWCFLDTWSTINVLDVSHNSSLIIFYSDFISLFLSGYYVSRQNFLLRLQDVIWILLNSRVAAAPKWISEAIKYSRRDDRYLCNIQDKIWKLNTFFWFEIEYEPEVESMALVEDKKGKWMTCCPSYGYSAGRVVEEHFSYSSGSYFPLSLIINWPVINCGGPVW